MMRFRQYKGDYNMRMNTFMKTFTILTVLMVMTIAVVSAATVGERRQEIRNVTNETLNEVYNVQPKARDAVANAAGYAAFTITDAKLVFLGGGGGKGMAVNNSTGQEIFMGADDVQVGFGLGVKKYDVLFVFRTEKALIDFSNKGWDVGGQATIAATDSVNGDSLEGAVSVAPDIWMYQLTDKGLEASITVRGIHYFQVKELN
jgi:lipid-binding SYLF domain-containing protein